MGCWNQTCGLTNLPIHYGDDVVCFILEQNQYSFRENSFCYSTDIYQPLFIPLFGEYNDYGSVEEIKDNFMADVFKHLIVNKSIYIAEDFDGERNNLDNADALMDYISDGDNPFRFKGYQGVERSFGFVLFHKKAYDNVINSLGNRIPYKQTKTYRELITDDYRAMLELKSKPVTSIEDKWLRFDNRIFESTQSAHLNNHILEFSINSKVEIDKLTASVVDFELINIAMSFLRKHWIPQCGQGSQCSENRLHKVLMQSSEEIIDDCNARYGEENYACEDHCEECDPKDCASCDQNNSLDVEKRYNEETIWFHQKAVK